MAKNVINIVKSKRIDRKGEYLIPAKNEAGDHVTLQFRCMPRVLREAQSFVLNEKFNYTCVSDFLRHAAQELIRSIHTEHKDIGKDNFAFLESAIRVQQDESEDLDFEFLKNSLHKNVLRHLTRGPRGEVTARKLVQDCLNLLRSGPPSEKTDFHISETIKMFRYLNLEKAKVSLKPSDQKGDE